MPKEVLIVEHDKDITWIKEKLSKKNIKCKEISYLKGALKLVLEEPERWKAIILDMKFPVDLEGEAISGTGNLFLKQLKERNIKIPVIINSRQLLKKEEIENYPFIVKCGQLIGHPFFDAKRFEENFEKIEQEEKKEKKIKEEEIEQEEIEI